MADPNKVTKLELRHLKETVEVRLRETADHYGLLEDPVKEERFKLKLELLLQAQTRDEADKIAKRTVDSLFWHCLSLWGKKIIRGPLTPDNLEKKAKQAENLAVFQIKLGNEEAAIKQRERAERLRSEATDLRTGKTAAPPVPGPMPRLSEPRKKHPKQRRPVRPKAKDLRPRRKGVLR